jgi:superfamily II DNA or RNA helicase
MMPQNNIREQDAINSFLIKISLHNTNEQDAVDSFWTMISQNRVSYQNAVNLIWKMASLNKISIPTAISLNWAMLMSQNTQDNTSKPEPEMPPLDKNQQDAVNFIISNWKKGTNTLCALDVGMGKTRIACEILSRLFRYDADIRLQGYALVCCPTTDIMETIWIETLKAYGLKNMILGGDELEIVKVEDDLTIPPLTVCLITYANIIRNDKIDCFISSPQI